MVESFAARAGLDAAVAGRLTLVLEELFTNTVRHGYRGAEGGVRLRLGARAGGVRVIYEDTAPPFDTSAAAPDPAAAVAAGRVGGMGLSLVQHLAVNLRYARRGNANRTMFMLRLR